MSRATPKVVVPHSAAWVIQTWLSFVLSVGVTAVGIWNLPVDIWVKAFLGMGLLFTVGSTFSLSKTVRDQHEMEQRVGVAGRHGAEAGTLLERRKPRTPHPGRTPGCLHPGQGPARLRRRRGESASPPAIQGTALEG